jgi:HEAT repeat protein
MLRFSLLLMLASACAAPSQAPSKRSEERRALFSAWSEGRAEFEAASIALVDDSELRRLWAEDLVLVMVASYRSGGVTAPGQLNGRFERAQRALLELGEVAVEPLVARVLLGNEIGARLALDILVEGGERSAAPILAGVMSGAAPSARARAASRLGELAFAGEQEAEVLASLESVLSSDPVWVCRAGAARSLCHRADKAGAVLRVRRALSRGLGDVDEGVQDACCAGLRELGDEEAVPALINHLERIVRLGGGLDRLREAQAALKYLTGTEQDLVPRAWRAVWAELRDSRQG